MSHHLPPYMLANLAKGTEARKRKAAERRARKQQDRQEVQEQTSAGALHENTRKMYERSIEVALQLYDRWLAKGGEPPRNVVDFSREARQLASEYRGILEAQGATAQADEFFSRLEAALREGAINLAEGAGPRPYLDVEDVA